MSVSLCKQQSDGAVLLDGSRIGSFASEMAIAQALLLSQQIVHLSEEKVNQIAETGPENLPLAELRSITAILNRSVSGRAQRGVCFGQKRSWC